VVLSEQEAILIPGPCPVSGWMVGKRHEENGARRTVRGERCEENGGEREWDAHVGRVGASTARGSEGGRGGARGGEGGRGGARGGERLERFVDHDTQRALQLRGGAGGDITHHAPTTTPWAVLTCHRRMSLGCRLCQGKVLLGTGKTR
jgi:hypothetical protein